MRRLADSMWAWLVVFSVCMAGTVPVAAQPVQAVFENYTLENGLSNNTVHQAFQDSRGYMWFATNHGICRYNGYQFTSFRNDPVDSNSLNGLLARVIYEDKKGHLWIGTESGGLNQFDRNTETFDHILTGDSSAGIGTSVKTIAEDRNGCLWLGTNIGIKVYNPATRAVKWYPFTPNSASSPTDAYVRELQFDESGKLWVGTNAGLDVFDPATGEFSRMYTQHPELKDEIWEIYRDPDGLLWVGTYNNGLFLINPSTRSVQKIRLDESRQWSKTIRSVVKDAAGLYWIGSRAGLFVYNSQTGNATWLGNVENEQKSLVNNSVLHVYKDAAQNLWISTRAGISLMVPGRQVFKHYKSQRNSNNHLNHNEVYAAWADKAGKYIWIGTDEGGVNILDRETQRFSYLMHNPANPNTISGNGIKAFMEDGRGNLWIGTYRAGISIYNLATGRITRLKNDPANPFSLSDNSIWALHRDKSGKIWVGTDNGLDVYDEATGRFAHQPMNGKVSKVSWISEDAKGQLWLGLQSTVVVFTPGTGIVATFKEQGSCFYEDAKGRHWLATRNNGIVLLDANNKVAKYYDERNGLPNNQAFEILEDNFGYLWISTANGLTRFNPEKASFANFDKSDGLQSNQFHYGAAYKLTTGELVFGGSNGFSLFDPGKVVKSAYRPPMVLTDLKIFNKSVRVNDNFSVLSSSIAETKKLSIPYKYNIITLEFAALNFVRPEKNAYKFKLTGFDKEWVEAGGKSSATYTNLDPGSYTFSVVATNSNNEWSTEMKQIEIVILPPFWMTWWFKLLAAIAILGGAYLVFSFWMNRARIKQQLEAERVKVRQLNEVNALKFQFFTNISHEIRTPLTLIMGPLERFKNAEHLPAAMKGQVDIMYRNANALMRLVNQLLDFRKLETGSLKLELRRGDLSLFVREIVESFSSLAEEKGIHLKFSAVNNSLVAYFDPDKIEKIMNNLLSNAFKFTAKKGTISVFLTMGINDSFENSEEYIALVVKDNGIGIAPSNWEKIFHRFFQVTESKNQGGTGIGLALTKELVKLHKGDITVDSEKGKGTRFTVRLPFVKDEVKPVEEGVAKLPQPPEQESMAKDELLEENILLVIEDNADVRQFIRYNLGSKFHVVEAADGSEGLNLAQKLLPDLILSDVMMPVLDGIEFCRRLKSDPYTSHIPVILLTALSSKQHTIEGLASGADDYITKPFDISILEAKMDNLLQSRDAMRKKITGELNGVSNEVAVRVPEDPFLQKALETVLENIKDAELDIEKFSRLMAVSRMQLYRKMSALTGMTVKEFIRDIRLQKAAELLEQKQLNISEVAYAVGFSDLSHFRKCFREKFGMNASEYLKQTGKVG